jgi:hypothetical protein
MPTCDTVCDYVIEFTEDSTDDPNIANLSLYCNREKKYISNCIVMSKCNTTEAYWGSPQTTYTPLKQTIINLSHPLPHNFDMVFNVKNNNNITTHSIKMNYMESHPSLVWSNSIQFGMHISPDRMSFTVYPY